MVHLTLAIADFMGILITAAAAAALSVGAMIVLGVAALCATLWSARMLVRQMLRR